MHPPGEFGDIVASTTDAIEQGFLWARSAVKQTTTSLLQLTVRSWSPTLAGTQA
jgi:hypothetical protein